MKLLLPPLLLLALSCQAPDDASRPDGPDPGVVCAGASMEEARAKTHPAILRGTVRAPQAVSSFSLIPSAHAYALDFETPIAGATVRLEDASGAALVTTRTGPRGRWCLRVPRGHALGPQMTLAAERGELRLRHVAAFRFDTEISAMSEALVRVIERAGTRRADLTHTQWLNLRTLTDTAVGLMSGMETEEAREVEALISEMQRAIEADARVRAWFESSARGAGSNE